MTRTGLERLLDRPKSILKGARVGLVANPTTVDRDLNHGADLLHAHPDVNLTLLLGPEHGVRAAAQDMIGVADRIDPHTGIPEVSLYGPTFESLSPTAEDLDRLDVLLFDLQDVGSRYYTYAATMALCMKAAKAHGKSVVILDRPNPIGGEQIEGGGLEPGLENFCGLYPIPQRHGLTVGELALLYNGAFSIGCDLKIVQCEQWRREQYFDELDLPWVMPSPNMPSLETAIVYPGMCLIEGTNLSEGRGTTRPFELVGAPFVDGRLLRTRLLDFDLEGVVPRPCSFEPMFHKHAGESCGGVQLHVTDRQSFEPLRTGLAIIYALRLLYPDQFAWRTTEYEFRDDVPAIDLLTGTARTRQKIDDLAEFHQVYDTVRGGTVLFDKALRDIRMYD